MTRYNHFAERRYAPIQFHLLNIGDKFRRDLFSGKRLRRDIVCIKTGEASCREEKSGKEWVYYNAEDLTVYNYSVKEGEEIIK